MKKKLQLVVLLSVLLLFELTAGLPRSRAPHRNTGREIEERKSETTLPQTKDASSTVLKSHVHRQKVHLPGPSHLHLASQDQNRKGNNARNAFHRWFSANHRKPKFIAISIFIGCVVFMALALAVACCWYHIKESKRIKKATHVDVQSRQELIPDHVSKIEDAHIDVGKH